MVGRDPLEVVILVRVQVPQQIMLETSQMFFTIFLATILIARIFLFVCPTPGPTIFGFRVHHYVYGLIILIIGYLFNSIILCAIGLGLFIDELTFLLSRGKTHEDNYSKMSLLGTACFVILVFVIKDYLISLLVN